jgi:hypothetical protein
MKIAAAFACLLAAQPAHAWLDFFKPQSAPTTVRVPRTGLPPKDKDNLDLDNIFYQNRVWKNEKLHEDPDFFNKLGSTHKPDFMFIGRCRILMKS